MVEATRKKNKWLSQRIQKRQNRGKNYKLFSRRKQSKHPIKQRNDRKKFKSQRSRKRVLMQMASDYNDFVFHDQYQSEYEYNQHDFTSDHHNADHHRSSSKITTDSQSNINDDVVTLESCLRSMVATYVSNGWSYNFDARRWNRSTFILNDRLLRCLEHWEFSNISNSVIAVNGDHTINSTKFEQDAFERFCASTQFLFAYFQCSHEVPEDIVAVIRCFLLYRKMSHNFNTTQCERVNPESWNKRNRELNGWIHSAKRIYIGLEIGSGAVQCSENNKGSHEIRNDQFLPVLLIERTDHDPNYHYHNYSYNTDPVGSRWKWDCYGNDQWIVCHCDKEPYRSRYYPHRGYYNFCHVHHKVLSDRRDRGKYRVLYAAG